MQRLGDAFHIATDSVKVFAESFIRSHVMFQAAKSLEMISTSIKHVLHLPPFTVISMQPAYGRVVVLGSIYDSISLKLSPGEKVIAFVEQADGTEEIPDNLAGVVLAHEVP